MSPTTLTERASAAGELTLRVSVAALVRVSFEHPRDGEPMLALERKATTLVEAGRQHVVVSAQPFGGAIRFRSLAPLQTLIGDFLFDSEQSRSENDFRILIRPAAWDALRQFCLRDFADADDPVLETDPARELAEEFADALAIHLSPDQYRQHAIGFIVADQPAPTGNPRAPGLATARIYRIFEAHILDAALGRAMLANSERYSDEDLRQQALAEARSGRPGRANAVLALPLKRLAEAYRAMPPAARAAPIAFEDHRLDANVPAVLEGLAAPSGSKAVVS